jgi:hypothetical protein
VTDVTNTDGVNEASRELCAVEERLSGTARYVRPDGDRTATASRPT